MKKRLIALILVLMMALTSVIYTAYTAPADANMLRIYKDFESSAASSSFDTVSGEGSIKAGGNNSDRMFSFDNAVLTGQTTGIIMLGDAVSSGVLKVKFDYKVSTYENNFFIRMVAGNGEMANTFCDRNTFTYYPKTEGWSYADKRVAYNINEWNTVSMYVNFDTRMVYFYKNDEMYGFTTLTEKVSDVTSLQFTCHGSSGNKYMDNLYVEHYNSFDETLPEEVRWTTTAQINTSAVGRIFYKKDLQTFTVTTANKTANPVEYLLKYSVLKGEKLLYTEETPLTMEPNEVKDTEIQTHTDGFGYYFVDAKLYDKQGNLMADADEVRFSVSNIPEEGLKNKEAGIQMNQTVNINHNDMVQDLKLIAPLGFTYSRASAGKWEILQLRPNHFEVPAWQQYIVEQFTEYGLEQTPDVAFENYLITPESPPRSPEAIEKYAWFAQQLMLYYHNNNFNKPRDYVDIWNEFWMNGSVFNRDNNTPEDYAHLLMGAYTAIKEVSPESRVFGFSGLDLKNLEWAQRVLAEGAANYMDGYSLHPYQNKTYPEDIDLPGFAAKIDAEFAKYGRYDLPVWISEWGWPSCGEDGYPDEIGQASYYVRAFVINNSHDVAELLNWYASNDLQNDNGQESRFGLFRNQYAEIGYEAKPAYMAAANYNAMMTDAEPLGIHELGENVTGYRYKLRDGRDCMVAWGVQFEESVAFELDTSSVTVYDMYGNDSKLYSMNNKFSMSFDITPQYIVGNFSSVKRAEPDIAISTKAIEMPKGDKAEFAVTKTDNGDLTVEADLPDNLSIVENNGFVNNECKVVLSSEVCEQDTDEFTVRVMRGDQIVYSTKVSITYTDALDFSILARPYSSAQMDRWVAQIKIKGNFYEDRPNGKLRVISPAAMAGMYSSVAIDKLGPGEEKIIRLNIPKSISSGKVEFKAVLEMEGYEPLEVATDVMLRCSPFAHTKPTIDGVINSGEWNERAVMIMEDTGAFVGGTTAGMLYTGVEDLSAKVYTAWDFENFYIAAEVTDDTYAYDKDSMMLWKSDGIQFAMAPSKTGTQMAQFDMAQMAGEDKIEMEISTNAANVGPVEEAEFKFTKDGTTQVYELRIPWKAIFPDGYNLRRNSMIPFSMLINDNDGFGREGFMENGGGIGIMKNVYDFLDLFLLF